MKLLEYKSMSAALESGVERELKYRKKDGSQILFRICRFMDYSLENKEMIRLLFDADEKKW